MILFKRPKTDVTDAARRRIWESRDGRYRVVLSRSLFGLPDVWYAMRHEPVPAPWGWCWSILSRNRKRTAAIKAVEVAENLKQKGKVRR